MPCRRGVRHAFALVVLLALVQAACTDNPEPTATPAGDATPPVSAPADPTPALDTTPAEATTTADPPADATPPDGPVEVTRADIVTGLTAPWDVAFAPGGEAFVVERDSGAVYVLAEDGALTELRRLAVDATSEGGLLGLIASPEFADDGLLYAYLTTDRDNRVVRFRVADDGEEEAIVTGIPKAGNHNGGRIAFGPDRLLYVATGDAGSPNLAQDQRSLAGKILRVDADGGVPDGNPFPGSPVYSLGHRNVQGLAWDADGELYATEFGPDRDDEINHIRAGANYGWPEVTGQAGRTGFADPILVRQPEEASWSGATFLLGGAIPQWEGDLFVASLRGQQLVRLRVVGGTVVEEEVVLNNAGRLRQVVQAPDGSLWILTSNRDGRGSPAEDDDRIIRLGRG